MKETVFLTLILYGNIMSALGLDPICADQTLGEASPTTTGVTPGPNTGATYVFLDTSMAVPCCGVVSQWRYATANAGDLTAQVWRNVAGATYSVQGQNVISGLASGTTGIYSVATTDRISVEKGDVIGMYSSANDIIPYAATGSAVMGRVTKPGLTASGSSATLPLPPVSGEQWMFGALLSSNTPPSFGTLPTTVTALASDAVGTVVHTIAPTDADPDDIAGLTVSINPASTDFELDGLDVKILQSPLAIRDHLVVIEVVDHCQETSTATLTVTVTDDRPEITSLPIAAALLREDATGLVELHTLTYTDDGDLDDVMCSVNSTDPSPAPFSLHFAPGTSDPTVYFVEDASNPLDYDVTPLYSLFIVCFDGTSFSTIKEFQVSIEPNEEPVPSIPAEISVSAATATTTTLVHTITSTDPENDDVTYSMSCTCPFVMRPDGSIYPTENLNTHRTSPYVVAINVSDGYNTVGETSMTIHITDINMPPNITDPILTQPGVDTVYVQEHTDEGTPHALGTTIDVFTALGLDTDGDTLTWDMEFDNGQGEQLYEYDSTTGLITTRQDLDYEILNNDALLTTRVYVRAFDGREYSETRILNIVVEDVNETPVFQQNKYAIETTEGTATTTLDCPFFDVVDEDRADTTRFDINCGAVGSFHIPTASTGACKAFIVQTEEFDLDSPGAALEVVSCLVTVTDKGGLTATTTLEITVHEEDDNPPVLDSTAYSYTITNATGPGSTIGNVDATDDDFLPEHRRHTYCTDSSEFGVDSNGVIYSKVDWSNYNVPTTRTFNLNVRDEAGHTDTAPVTVLINPTYTTTTTTTQATSSSGDITSFFDDPGNMAWFIPAMILLAALLGLLGYLIYRACTNPRACSSIGKLFRFRGRRGMGRLARARARQMPARTQRAPPPRRVIEQPPPKQQKQQNAVRKPPQQTKKKSDLFDCFRRRPPPKQVDEAKEFHLWGQGDFRSMNKWVG